ncbi:MAG: TadE/TadG family type IV pilus assembly protein [Sphingomonadaceae bacterium]
MIDRLARIARRLPRDARGSSIVEFAVIAPVMLIMIMGMMELSYKQYGIGLLQGAVQKAARDASLQTGGANVANLDARVQAIYSEINSTSGKTFAFTRRNFSDFTSASRLEPSNGPGGRCAPPPPPPALPYSYTDINSDLAWGDVGAAGQGGAQDVVLYTVTVSYPSLLPVAALIGMSPMQTISASTVLRNQPFANQAARVPGTTLLTCPLSSPLY